VYVLVWFDGHGARETDRCSTWLCVAIFAPTPRFLKHVVQRSVLREFLSALSSVVALAFVLEARFYFLKHEKTPRQLPRTKVQRLSLPPSGGDSNPDL
jgi:hypothetical protein